MMSNGLKSKKAFFSILLLFILVVLTGIAMALVRALGQRSILETNVPVFTLETFDGEKIDTRNYADKVLVINFWASWCKTCEEEAKMLEDVWQQLRTTNKVNFIGINYADTEKEALAYIKKYNIAYPNGMDKGLRISKQFGVKGVPETFIVNREGIIKYRKIGPFTSEDEIMAILNEIVTE